MVRLKSCCAVAPALSWTWIVNVAVWTVVGVPEMVTQCTPHWRGSFSVRPSGRRPATRFQVKGVGPVPPLWEMAWLKKVPTLPGPRAQTPLVQVSPAVRIASGEPVTVNTADWVTPPDEAVMVTLVLAGTAAGVVTVKDAAAEPAATVTLAGTPATFRLLLDSATFVAAGAAALRVTVPVEEVPPTTLVGLRVRPLKVGAPGAAAGVSVSVAPTVAPPEDAEMVTAVLAFTAVVVTVKEAVDAPATMVTLAGTPARALPLARATVVAEAAAALELTVPWAGFPPTTLVGVSARAFRTADGCGAQPARVACAELAPSLTSTWQLAEL